MGREGIWCEGDQSFGSFFTCLKVCVDNALCYHYLANFANILGTITSTSSTEVTGGWLSNFEEDNKSNIYKPNPDENTSSWVTHFGEETSQTEPNTSSSHNSEYKFGKDITVKLLKTCNIFRQIFKETTS